MTDHETYTCHPPYYFQPKTNDSPESPISPQDGKDPNEEETVRSTRGPFGGLDRPERVPSIGQPVTGGNRVSGLKNGFVEGKRRSPGDVDLVLLSLRRGLGPDVPLTLLV